MLFASVFVCISKSSRNLKFFCLTKRALLTNFCSISDPFQGSAVMRHHDYLKRIQFLGAPIFYPTVFWAFLTKGLFIAFFKNGWKCSALSEILASCTRCVLDLEKEEKISPWAKKLFFHLRVGAEAFFATSLFPLANVRQIRFCEFWTAGFEFHQVRVRLCHFLQIVRVFHWNGCWPMPF